MSTIDIDPQETREWLEALDGVLAYEGRERARTLVERVVDRARHAGAPVDASGPTPYVNTIPVEEEPEMPGDPALERRVRSLIRWNAMALVLRANKESSELGGHLSSYQSAATLYEVGFNHFWHAPSEDHGGDLVYIQGHSSPGVYARAFLEGRLTEEQMLGFRQEVDGQGLSSYPHPWLMPDFWQFPTVSMGLGPIMGIYQARFMRYLTDRGVKDTRGRKVWVYLGDGECDEPESLGAISLAGREKLDNLIFVVNCNLQRLDGPVRGNGKIIQELETIFRGAGWNVIKLIWGSRWDPLLASPAHDVLVRRMEEALDGDYQTYKARDGAFVREHFFGTHPELRQLVAGMSDDEIWALNRGGHDAHKIHAAYHRAVHTEGRPTVILAKTVKGYGMGEAGEGMNISHQAKKMTEAALFKFRDRFELDLTDEEVASIAFHRPPEDSDEMRYLQERRGELGGYLPQRRRRVEKALEAPPLESFKSQLEGTGDREISTTMAFVRILAALLRSKPLGERIVPIVPDESRTFGMEGMFRQLGIYSHIGQLYKPEDAEQLMFYKEDRKGQILQEGINEAGATSSWIAAGTAYSNHDVQMLPVYVFYSMFGFQRTMDLIWAGGDSRTRGFLMGGTAGRTTLNGEGLQHEDGHSHLLSSVVPNCVSYDPAFAHELAVIVQDGVRRMVAEQEDVFFYITLMNENYRHPPMREGAEEGINEAGATSSWIAAGTAYSNHDVQMLPVYVFYSMFGFQRTMDLIWAGGDSRTRGFLMGGTAGRTTLNGEGLQHEDGHSHLLSSVVPNCVSYDPAFAHELAVIVQDGVRRMVAEQEDVFFYITLMNENYRHPPMREGAEEGILRGMHPVRDAEGQARVQLLGAGTILNEVLAAADLLREDFDVEADVWSVTSFNELRRDGRACDRWNLRHPAEEPRKSWVEQCLAPRSGPVVAASDYVSALADGIRPFVPRRYRVLGTDGYGRSDYRVALRRFFEVDRQHVAVAALAALADEGEVERRVVAEAMERYGIDPGKPDPAAS